jgi:lipopolysaccharide biosynthesis regulator YciM
MAKNDYLTARTKLKQALSYDRNCIRASLLAASVEFKTGHYSRSIKHLRKVREQDLVFIPETLTLLQSCFQALDDKDGFKDYLVETHEYYSSTSVLLALVAQIKADRGKAAAAVYLSAELKKRQSLKGLAMLIDLHLSDSSGREREDLSILQMLIDQLLQNKPGYQCHQCGFAGRSLHWLCPSCKQWGQIKLIRGVEGD